MERLVLLTSYAGAFNRRHKRVGHLFQNRDTSIGVEAELLLREWDRLSRSRGLRLSGQYRHRPRGGRPSAGYRAAQRGRAPPARWTMPAPSLRDLQEYSEATYDGIPARRSCTRMFCISRPLTVLQSRRNSCATSWMDAARQRRPTAKARRLV
jgi:hypothetical protein